MDISLSHDRSSLKTDWGTSRETIEPHSRMGQEVSIHGRRASSLVSRDENHPSGVTMVSAAVLDSTADWAERSDGTETIKANRGAEDVARVHPWHPAGVS